MATALKRTGTNHFSAMLGVKAKPIGWGKEPLLLHFIEESGASTVFVVTDQAIESFAQCECYRIYDIVVPGKCVHTCNGVQKYGVRTGFEVNLKYPCKVTLSKKAWPFHFPYNFHVWDTLNQVAEGSCLDLIGEVLETPVHDVNSSLKKLVVQLGSSDMQLRIELLGDHGLVKLVTKDKVAFSGIRINVWNGQRTLQTSYLTVIEVNPKISEEKMDQGFQEIDDGPKRKAIRLTLPKSMTVAEVKTLTQQFLQGGQFSSASDIPAFAVTGKFSTLLSTDFFELDPPLLDTTRGEVMCWKAQFDDDTGHLDVKVWDKACYELFRITGSRMRELWEEGNEQPDRQAKILGPLNDRLAVKVMCVCKAEVWSSGQKEKKHEVQINVNLLEIVE